MAIDSIPVTFDVRAEQRPELIEARRRRARPYRIVALAVSVLTALGVGFGFLAGEFVQPSVSGALSARPPAPVAASASFPVWTPPTPPLRHAAKAPAESAEGVDFTPVGSITDAAASQPRVFAPAERGPGYAGFKVTAGQAPSDR